MSPSTTWKMIPYYYTIGNNDKWWQKRSIDSDLERVFVRFIHLNVPYIHTHKLHFIRHGASKHTHLCWLINARMRARLHRHSVFTIKYTVKYPWIGVLWNEHMRTLRKFQIFYRFGIDTHVQRTYTCKTAFFFEQWSRISLTDSDI